jgi:hypothetical protein
MIPRCYRQAQRYSWLGRSRLKKFDIFRDGSKLYPHTITNKQMEGMEALGFKIDARTARTPASGEEYLSSRPLGDFLEGLGWELRGASFVASGELLGFVPDGKADEIERAFREELERIAPGATVEVLRPPMPAWLID